MKYWFVIEGDVNAEDEDEMEDLTSQMESALMAIEEVRSVDIADWGSEHAS